ncbi:aldehyde dehydrogenase family protein [Hyphococcus flavus]|uniref:Aldehyde dehydrogenase family protein n=1 Tax=Hyphococcus flavus TaxID=1866326 RepID=A0AAF0CFZ2_9PROT|nr:aldehyde dehydrogenase family protein [Hyphococcus flavus]WDI30117.1 aldehyde dehydrogenase family protein [Hyphococcus flavus]
MRHSADFYIDGEWVSPVDAKLLDVVNPATEEAVAQISLGTPAHIDAAVAAAQNAFDSFSQTSKEERQSLLDRIIETYQKRYDELAETITLEMGAPLSLSKAAQAAAGLQHLKTARKVLADYSFEEKRGSTRIKKEPIGVCGFITPWNWPLNQVTCKVGPAIAAGCTMVLKPSEIAPLSSIVFADILHEAGVPKGVFNLVNGEGPDAGQTLSSHPGVDMMSFTGSTRGGVAVAKAAADTVKRVTQELGGKSPNIILDDADIERAVKGGVMGCMLNTGQSCNAPTRMLVPADMHDKAAEIAKAAAEKIRVGGPRDETTTIGPAVSEVQWNKIQDLIQKGIDEGAKLMTGGTGRPDGLNKGYFVKPTVFANVNNDMAIAQEEIFGPVLSILPYADEAEAVKIANDTIYGLSAYVSGSPSRAASVASKLRAGMVHVNGAMLDHSAPFGGYKMSGNGREWGVEGFEEFLETKAVMGLDE